MTETLGRPPGTVLPPPGQLIAPRAFDDGSELPLAADQPLPLTFSLRAGCHLLRFTPAARGPEALPLHYDGTLRVDFEEGTLTASGDLYVHHPPVPGLEEGAGGAAAARDEQEPDPAAGIPVFARRDYRYYVRVTRVSAPAAPGSPLELGFELHRLEPGSASWAREDVLVARLSPAPPPAGFPAPGEFLQGPVFDGSGVPVGELSAGWISEHLRRAVVEVDRSAESEAALANAAGVGWGAVFASVGWQLTVDQSDADIREPSGESWSDAEMHAALLACRDAADLDIEWRYWLLCVRRLDSTERGLMFDGDATDSNAVPREGAAIASHWAVPDAPLWGRLRGLRFGVAVDAYFRTAVHELGHAMGLQHNTSDNGYMQTTPDIAARAVAPQEFPDNVSWGFSPDDARRLRHLPDPWVRPGGVPFGASHPGTPAVARDEVVEPDGLLLTVAPVLDAVPIGAPVRVEVELRNDREAPLQAPRSLSLKGGAVSGRVIDPSGHVRSFRPLLRCADEQQLETLAAGTARWGSLTLLRGAEGALFPTSGAYTVEIDVDWRLGATPVRQSGRAAVMVTGARDDSHAELALRLLSTPDAMLAVALGGDHLGDGVEAISAALASDVLRPHYAWLESKRVARPFRARPADPARAARLLDERTVLSRAERRKALELARRADETTGGGLAERIRAGEADDPGSGGGT